MRVETVEALALVLVVAAVTLARNGAAAGAMDLGFDTDGVMPVNVRGTQDELARPLADALDRSQTLRSDA